MTAVFSENVLEHWSAVLTILAAMVSPFGMYAMAQVTLTGAIVLSVIAGITSAATWVNSSLARMRERQALEESNDKQDDTELELDPCPPCSERDDG